MRPPVPAELLDRVDAWASLTGGERADVGRTLRRLGWTYGEIQQVLPVAKGTLAGWCRHIALDDQHRADIAARRPTPRDTQRKRRHQIAQIRVAARTFAENHLNDPLFVAGTVLYWAEGAKTKHLLAVSNSDPAALRLFIRWARHFHDPNPEFVLSLHLHAGDRDHAAREWWLDALALEQAHFTRTFIKPTGTGHRKNRLPHGVCRVRMRRGTDACYRTAVWIDVVGAALTSDTVAGDC